MSQSRLDQVKTYDQFGLDHWKAVGTKLGGVEVVKSILRDMARVTVEIVRRLTPLARAPIGAGEVGLLDFFKIREGLWLSENFQRFILSCASEGSVSFGETVMGYADLVQAANEVEVESELPEGHVFEVVDTFLGHLSIAIENQWGGLEGVLLRNGYTNIFYVKVNGKAFAVDVKWNFGCRVWECRIRHHSGGHVWDAGSRAFSATAALA